MIRRDEGKMTTVFVDPCNAALHVGYRGAVEAFEMQEAPPGACRPLLALFNRGGPEGA